MISIYFLEKSISFNKNNLNTSLIAGSEKTLINISSELAKNKLFKIKVFNKIENESVIDGVEWCNINNLLKHPKADHVVSMSDMNLFPNYKCKKYLWSHSIQPIEKFVRKNQLIPYFLHRPKIILEGDYHYKKRSFFTSMFGKEILKICADIDFIEKNIDVSKIPEKNVIFNTRPDRNLNIVMDAWKVIKQNAHDAKLYINPHYELSSAERDLDIFVRNKSNKSELINHLCGTKLMINPGHKGEVFCLVAEEARALCIPIVTLGLGALYERVDHGNTGFICKNLDDLIVNSIKILNNDDLYLKFKSNLHKIRQNRTYKDVASDFLKILDLKNSYDN